jgi:hypothetical protein
MDHLLRVAFIVVVSIFSPLLSQAQDLARLRRESIANLVWQWDNNPASCRKALGLSVTDSSQALAALQEGQAHNAGVRDLYRVSWLRLGDFWFIVASASNSRADFDSARVNINWQFAHNLGSLDSARQAWRAGNRIKAIHALLEGQAHNLSTLNLYRACFRDDRARLFVIVNEVLGS